MSQIHRDAATGQEFATEAEYLAFTSPVTGYKPTDIEHHGERGILVAKKALERTGSLDTAAETALDNALTRVRSNDVEHKLAEVRAGRGPKA